jgi:mannose-6-phosphate isomerase-like protein (cupin superfamily)
MSFTKPGSTFFATQRVEKPWGHELLWAWTERYAGKILHVRAGESLSLQRHHAKDETLSVLRGRITVEHGEDPAALRAREMAPGDCLRVVPGMLHRIRALEDTDMLEVSTPELSDVERLEDRYGRT